MDAGCLDVIVVSPAAAGIDSQKQAAFGKQLRPCPAFSNFYNLYYSILA